MSRSLQAARSLALALSSCSTIVLVGWLMVLSGHGFELTDEGYYLIWISRPWDFDASVTHFGFIYHPLYLLTGGNIALLRCANIGLLFGLGLLTSYALFWSVGKQRADRSSRVIWLCSAVAAAASTLVLFSAWLPSPSYNSLTLQSLMVTAAGAVLAGRDRSFPSVLGWVLLGLGGAATFMAKPPSALVLGGLIPLYLAIAGKLRLRGLGIAISVSSFTLILLALAIDGSLSAFVQRMVSGKELSDLLQAGHGVGEIFRWDSIDKNDKAASVFTYFMLGSFLSVGFVLLWRQYIWPWSVIANAAILIAIVLAVAGIWFPNPSSDAIQPNQFLGVALGIALALFIMPGWRALMTRELGAAVFLLLFLPIAYAAGTNTNLWSAAARAAAFWLLAGLVLAAAAAARDRAWEAMPLAATLGLLIPCYILAGAIEAPYRQTRALRLQTVDVELSEIGSHLLLSEETAAYVVQIRKIAADGGFRGGDSLIDLTGTNPATAFFLNARPPISVWMAGGYPGAMDYGVEALRRTPCAILAASWILLDEPLSSPVSPPQMLQRFGIDMSADLTSAGSVELVRGFEPRHVKQTLLRPVRDRETARLACEDARRRGG
ncbi:hypothetical protein [Bradyrhizobium betae]|uniref:Glycosyltransferase RgtA/B/C/D-like domain-containing protein n=1 Tax=Bradyrhizobium betae TaxID=244734 RepID=A0A4V1P677_9BRAD|nr:hypothetical protein [Bradyrhizobium betae]RXT46649.1 hypothetical protein B5V03_17135 [Bradyrhizobium betae]